jgi:hypothetical protein
MPSLSRTAQNEAVDALLRILKCKSGPKCVLGGGFPLILNYQQQIGE